MEEIISEYVHVAIEIIIFSMVLVLLIFFSGKSYEALNQEHNKKAIAKQIAEYRQIYPYDNKTINANDVLVAVQKYTRAYQMDIQLGGKDSTTWIHLNTNDITNTNWDIENIKNQMQNDMDRQYQSVLIKDSSGTLIGFSFRCID